MCFQYLRKLRDQNRHFDLIVLDPPNSPPPLPLLNAPPAVTRTSTCLLSSCCVRGSARHVFLLGGVSADLFRKIVAGAALDAGSDAQVIDQFHSTPDHPVSLAFPEGEYLKGLLCHVS
jgi:23S rRNA (cytosine1962-C5)-methyltransferase